MPRKHCCYGTCTSDNRYPENGVSFVPFMKPHIDEPRCRKWIHACRREHFTVDKITKNTFICSKHFVGGKGPTPDNSDPFPATILKIPRERSKRRHSVETTTAERHKREQDSPFSKEGGTQSQSNPLAPEVNLEPESQTSVTPNVGCSEKPSERTIDIETQTPSSESSPPNEEVNKENDLSAPEIDIELGNETLSSNLRDQSCQTSPKINIDNEAQTCFEVESIYVKQLEKKLEVTRQNLSDVAFNVETCKRNEPKFQFYTGLTVQQFSTLFDFLAQSLASLRLWQGPQRKEYKRKSSNKSISFENQLFITLTRLHCGLLVQDLAYRFQISCSYVSKIVLTWIQFMFGEFKKLDTFPSAESTKAHGVPKPFKSFPNIGGIIDAFEINLQKPKDYREQGNTYSSYKSHNTVKFLVGIVPTGGICFISEGYEGCISDRDLVQKSKFLDHMHENDLIMADRGFDIADLCNKHRCSIVIPPFLEGRDKLTKEEVLPTRQIAAARIHIERSIGRLKQFRLLQKVLPKTLLPIVSQLVFVAAMLVNFQEPLLT